MREEKQLLLDDIKEKIDGSAGFIIAKYNNLSPNLSSDFRLKLGKAGASVEVVKKRILIKAAETAGITLDIAALNGHISVIFAEADAIAVTKALIGFAKENEDVLQVLLGHFEGKLCTAKDVDQISKLPDKDQMRSEFLGLLEAPMAQVLATMEAVLTSVPYCLENKSQQANS